MNFKNKFKNTYEAIIILLAILSIVMIFLDFSQIINIDSYPFYEIDQSIWIIFVFDYFGGLILSKNKKSYIKNHIFDLLAIIPLNSFFSVFKIFRITKLFKLAKLAKIFRLLRLVGIAGKLRSKIIKFLKTNGFIYLVGICTIILIIAALIYSLSEKISFDNALWWAITTSTTVGYGDVSPTTPVGKIIAVILMLVGISFVGMLTSTFTSFFTKDDSQTSNADELMKYKKLLDADAITQEEYDKKKKELLN